MRPLEALARSYLDQQQLRLSLEARLRKLLEGRLLELWSLVPNPKNPKRHEVVWRCPEDQTSLDIDFHQDRMKCENGHIISILAALKEAGATAYDLEIYKVLTAYRSRLHNEEKAMLEDSKHLITQTAVFKFCKAVKGLGDVAALTFLGYIDPARASTAGKAKAFIGFIPNTKLKGGERAHFNPELKGRFWMITRNVIMNKDPYYYPLYAAKKEYYGLRPDFVAEKDGGLKGWKGKVNNYAVHWLAGLLISHAAEIIRADAGLDTSAFRSHRGYIPPPPFVTIQTPREPNVEASREVERTNEESEPPQAENQKSERTGTGREPQHRASHAGRRTTQKSDPSLEENQKRKRASSQGEPWSGAS